MKPSERMLALLRERGLDIPEGSEIRRTYAGRVQRAEGAWSWFVWHPEQALVSWTDVGSQFPLGTLLAGEFELDRDRYGMIHVDPTS